jgi:hypothetical protein
MNYVAKIEGQEIPLPPEIGETDDAVRKALAPYYPEVTNALITRVVTDDLVTLTIVKKAGSKGAAGLDALRACQGGQNPAVALYEEILHLDMGHNRLDPVTLLELDRRIGEAIIAGEEQAGAVKAARARLAAAVPQPSRSVPLGF